MIDLVVNGHLLALKSLKSGPNQVPKRRHEHDRPDGYLPFLHLAHLGGARGLRDHRQDQQDHQTGWTSSHN